MREILPLSVIICTYNREVFLRRVLDSLACQTLSQDNFEIVIVDDGSSDNTREVVEHFISLLPLKYFYQHNAGLASAKNHGIYASRGKILLFLDDDDVAMPILLEEHHKTHGRYPEDNYAVLHYTAWAPDLAVTSLMHFITEVGGFLFSYPCIKNGDFLDYTYFWGGRSSCKRAFLLEHGVFNPIFRFGCEDIELGYRLSLHGLKVIYNNRAVSKMIRPVAFDDFCERLVRQGRSQYIFGTLHNDPNVHAWAEIADADKKWKNIEPVYNVKLRSARELDKIANMKQRYHLDLDDLTRRLVFKSYWWAFKACKIRGIIEAKKDAEQKGLKDHFVPAGRWGYIDNHLRIN
jgi:glycosyltransferase involved in cell wall biosynthesis